MVPVCVGFKAHLGWLNAVAVDARARSPRPLWARRLELLEGESRSIREPYHVAGGWHGLEQGPRPDDPAAVIRRGRQGQAKATRARLMALGEWMNERELAFARGVILTGRGRLGRDLEDVLRSHAQIHVAEGEAVRDALRGALDALGIEKAEQDEKRILDECAAALGRDDCDSMMKALKPGEARSWRKEERLIGLGAWLRR